MDIKDFKPKFVPSNISGHEYPLRIPPRPEKPKQLDIDDMERVQRYRKLYGGCISDAMHQSGIVDTILDHGIKPLKAHDVIAGRCIPVKWHSVAFESHLTEEERKARDEKWKKEGSPQKMMHSAIKPGSVLVFDNGGDMQAALFGEMSCNLAKSRGAVGVVNNGRTRDCKMIYSLGDFPYFTRGTTPNAYGGWRILDVNVPIYMPGHIRHYVIVNPGDFIFGDDDGLQVIPKDYVDHVLLIAEAIYAQEIEQRDIIRDGASLDDVYKYFGDL